VSESRSTGWPSFVLVTVKVSPDMPLGVQVLATRGVPRRIIGHEFVALPEAQFVADDSGGTLVAFGSCGLRGVICLDPSDGSVVHVPSPSAPERHPVNSSIEKFIESSAAVIQRFPFYCDDDNSDQWETVAGELATTLGDIDSATALHNSFWVTFLDDVRMGDYSTTMIVDE